MKKQNLCKDCRGRRGVKMKCIKCNKKMTSLGMEKVEWGKEYKGKVNTLVCLEDDSFIFIPIPKQNYLFWNEVKGLRVGSLKRIEEKGK